MPQAAFVLHPNLIAKQHFRAAALPAAVPCAREHEATGRVEVDGRDHAAAVAGDDGERHGAVAGRVGLCHVVDP
jgi:hypothetical protein